MTTAPPNPKRASVSELSKQKPHRHDRSAPKRHMWSATGGAAGATRPDWIIVALPTALSIKTLYSGASEILQLVVLAAFALICGLLIAAAFMRRTGTRFQTQLEPLVLLFGASAIALTRPYGIYNVLVFLLVSTLTLRLIKTVDARRITASLVDGVGLYLLANVLGYVAGLRSPSEGVREGLYADGLNRIIFPLAHSVNLPPALAASYAAAVYFVIREPGLLRRIFRITCLLAAIIILAWADSRVAAVAALALPITAILFPAAYRWAAPAFAVLASCSAVVLPGIASLIQSFVGPLLSLISDRQDSSHRTIEALNGREYIWGRSLNFWRDEVNSTFHIFLGYGMEGHYRSGASLTYYQLFTKTSLFDPIKASVHNSYLQQLFDGGIIGWILLSLAIFWASVRLSRRVTSWGTYGMAAIMTMSAVLLCSMTEVFLSPNVNFIPFWVVIILVGATCQGDPVEDKQIPGEPMNRQASGRH